MKTNCGWTLFIDIHKDISKSRCPVCEQELDIKEIEEIEESSPYKISQQVELQNTGYLNKIFLFSVA